MSNIQKELQAEYQDFLSNLAKLSELIGKQNPTLQKECVELMDLVKKQANEIKEEE